MDSSRRRFIKGALVGGIAVATSGGLTRVVTGLTGTDAVNIPYPNDIQQERLLKAREYVVMTEEEKEELIQQFINNYKTQVL